MKEPTGTSPSDFNQYPFDELPALFWSTYQPRLEAVREALPAGMKAYGGCGYGIFESSQDLVGFESLCVMQYDDPELFADLFRKIGDLYVALWSKMIREYGDIFVFFRMGMIWGTKPQPCWHRKPSGNSSCPNTVGSLIWFTNPARSSCCTVAAASLR